MGVDAGTTLELDDAGGSSAGSVDEPEPTWAPGSICEELFAAFWSNESVSQAGVARSSIRYPRLTPILPDEVGDRSALRVSRGHYEMERAHLVVQPWLSRKG